MTWFSRVLKNEITVRNNLDIVIAYLIVDDLQKMIKQVLSNRNMIDYAAVQSDECPNRTARPERPFPDGPAAARL